MVAIIKNGVCQLYSRKAKEITTVPHIINFLSSQPDCILDGELYSHELDFQKFISVAKKYDEELHTKLKFIVYDVIAEGTFEERFVKADIPTGEYVSKLTTQVVNNHEEIEALHKKFVEDGYEGAILRHGDCLYEQNKRSRNLLKVKDFTTEEFEIVGAKENRGKLEGTCIFIMKTADGAEFEALPDGNQEHREQLWQSHADLIGKVATIKFFEWTDSDPPVPRFPIFIGVRDYE